MLYNNRPITHIPSTKTTLEIKKRQPVQETGNFADILKGKLDGGVKISKHAQTRMEMRNMKLTESIREKLCNAIDKANEKGVKDTLIVMEQMAFVVNVRNRTVITAMNSKDMRDNVFTNIDGAVFTD